MYDKIHYNIKKNCFVVFFCVFIICFLCFFVVFVSYLLILFLLFVLVSEFVFVSLVVFFFSVFFFGFIFIIFLVFVCFLFFGQAIWLEMSWFPGLGSTSAPMAGELSHSCWINRHYQAQGNINWCDLSHSYPSWYQNSFHLTACKLQCWMPQEKQLSRDEHRSAHQQTDWGKVK